MDLHPACDQPQCEGRGTMGRLERLRTTRCLLIAILLTLLGAGPTAAEDALSDRERYARALRSPVAGERFAAVRSAAAHGGAARTWSRTWVRAPDARLRAGGWAVLARVGAGPDLRAALEALADPQPSVAREAAAAVLRMAERLPLEADPWLPAGTLRGAPVRALAFALAQRLDGAPASTVPAWVTRLGEGVVPCLLQMLRHPRFDTGPRAAAVAALAAVGGDGARRALSDLVPLLHDSKDYPLWEAWWKALIEVGPGKGLEGAHGLVVSFCEFAGGGRGGDRPPGLRWRNQAYFYRFLATCPPADGITVVRGFLDDQLERAAQAGRWRLWPSLAADVVRAHLVIAEPNDDRLEWDVLAARPPPRNGWRRRQEELGNVLAHLEPYKARAGLQKGLTSLLRRSDLPKTVKAWALYLQGETPPDEVRALAAALIDADGAAATLAQRRLGARLLDQLGKPGAARIRSMLSDLDGWMRAMGLRWATRAVANERFPPAERDAAVRKGLRDTDDGAFLLSAELAPESLGAAEEARLLRIAVSGPRLRRGRAWSITDERLGAGASAGEDPFQAPGGHAALDARLRAAALARRLWGEKRR